jgi:ubiquinone/menaquinone biosynthesis C-methylase UbiE
VGVNILLSRQTNDVKKFTKFYESDFGRKVLQLEANYLRSELSGRRRILDVGCGIGYFEEMLPELNITGLDSSKEMLEEVRRRSDKKFVLGDAENLDFPAKSFDAVFMVTTLEFVKNYAKAIDETARVLVSGGKLVLMILNPESEYFKEHVRKKDSYFVKIKHTNLKEVERYIQKLFVASGEYFLGIQGLDVFDTNNKSLAALYVIKGIKA